MSGGRTKRYQIAEQFYTTKPEIITNKIITTAISLIPGYPRGRKFSDGAFNMIYAAIVTEIEKIEKETKINRDDFGILTSI